MRAALASLLLATACGGGPSAERPRATPAASSTASAAPPLPPTSAPSSSALASASPVPAPAAEEVESLPVPGYLDAVVVTPAHARTGAPVVLVTHGAGGRPEPHCERYRQLVKGRAFILCTRGRASNKHLPEEQRGYFYDGHPELGKEARLALSALRERHGARVDPEGTIYAGYSQGAAMGILYLQQGGASELRSKGVLLVEGGAAEWSVALAKKLAREGVARVAIVCGQAKCVRAARSSRPWIEQGGLKLEISYAQAAGHTYGGDVAPLVETAFGWLTEDDPRFAL